MRNRIAGIMHWEHVGIEHASPPRASRSGLAPRADERRTRNPAVAIAAATLLGVAVVLTLRALFGAPSARA